MGQSDRVAADDVDVCVRGERLSAGLIAEGGGDIMSREASSLQPTPLESLRQTGRLLFSPETTASLSNFQALSNLKSINVCLPSPLTSSLPRGFLPATFHPHSRNLLSGYKWGGFSLGFILLSASYPFFLELFSRKCFMYYLCADVHEGGHLSTGIL